MSNGVHCKAKLLPNLLFSLGCSLPSVRDFRSGIRDNQMGNFDVRRDFNEDVYGHSPPEDEQ